MCALLGWNVEIRIVLMRRCYRGWIWECLEF